MGKTLTLVAAMGRNRAIGLAGRMPWHLPSELQHFKRVTMGKSIVMGRKTWQAIGRPLPGRQNIVISRNPAYLARFVELVGSLEEALEIAESDEVMIIGGGQVYELAMPQAQRMVLTLIDIEPEADTWFPAWDQEEWVQTGEEQFSADRDTELAYRIVEFRRVADRPLP
jgi:dihydrofolate reductase